MLTANLAPRDYTGEANAVFGFVRDQIRFVRDIDQVETLQTPSKTLAAGAGDCDDKSTLLGALLLSIGHPTRFVAVGDAPDQYSHVFVETLIGNTWVPADATEDVQLGWYPPGMVSRMVVYC
jgi:transglutaminase-like putative cysteine protease